MKNFKIVDCLVQIALLICTIPWYLVLFLEDVDFAGAWSFTIPYFVIGSWQLLSTLTHVVQPQSNKKIPRRIYDILLAIILISTFIAYFQLDGISLLFLGLLFLSPVMAIYYCIVCIIETRAIKKKVMI